MRYVLTRTRKNMFLISRYNLAQSDGLQNTPTASLERDKTPHQQMSGNPVGLGCRIYRLHLCREVKLLLLYIDLRPGQNMPFQSDAPEGSDTSQWPVIERNRVGGIWLMK